MQIQFETSQLEQLAVLMQAAPGITRDEIHRFVTAITQHLQGEVQGRTPTNYGTLRASIFGNVEVLPGVGVEGVVSTSLGYAEAVELGTRPHMPPVEPLVAWAAKKLGVRGKEARSAAWRIARKIARVGTEGHFMFRDAFNDNEEQIVAGLDHALDRITARIVGAQ